MGAIITIPDLKAGATTDSEGHYEINNLPKGTYLVQVHMLSYNTIATTVAISGVTTRNFSLSESILERSEVVITGTSLATEQRKSTTPITSVRMKELQENASTNIVDAIAKLPGVTQVTTGPAISKPVIRGLGSNRIITISDNIRQEGQQWGDEHGIEIDDYNVSKIEVLKGPASLAYGSDALAGVINILTDEPVQDQALNGNVSANYQTNSGVAVGSANLQGSNNGLSWKVYGTYKAAHDYKNKYDGHVYNSRFNNLNYGASIGINKQSGYSRLSFSSFNQNLGIAEGERDSATGSFIKMIDDNGQAAEQTVTNDDGTSYTKGVPRQRIEHQKLAWNNALYLKNGGRIGLTLGYQQNTRKEFEDVVNPDEPGLYFLLKTFNYDLKYFFSQAGNWQVTAGINGMSQHNENKGLEFLVPDYKVFDIGAYAIARRDFDQWSFSAGLRYDLRTLTVDVLYVDSLGERVEQPVPNGQTRFAAFDRNFNNLTGSAGLSYTVDKRTTLKFNVASGYRAPNIAELSANGVHEGTIRYEYGNKDLKAEQSFQADLGLDYNADHIYVNAALFANYITNFIYIRKLPAASGGDSIPAENNEEGVAAFIYDQGNALLYGGELYVDLHPHPLDWLHLENTFSYVRGKRTGTQPDSLSNLPYMPPARWLIEFRAQKRSVAKWLKAGYVKVGADINFDQPDFFGAYETELYAPGYVLFSAGAGADIVNKKQKTILSVTLSAQNLFDIAYQNHLSRLRYAPVNYATGRQGIWGMGRNFSLLVSVPLQF